jgi:hypothetical protein
MRISPPYQILIKRRDKRASSRQRQANCKQQDRERAARIEADSRQTASLR